MAAYWGIAAHSAYDMFSWYKYLSVILVFSHFLIAPFPDHCLFVLFSRLFVFLIANIVIFLQKSISLDPQSLTLAMATHRNCHRRKYLSLNISVRLQ